MKRKLTIILVFMLTASLSAPAYAHSGKTDANGGHYDHSTGEYHYHHGYPAHQHTNGICPYDFDDRTGWNSGSSSSSSDPPPRVSGSEPSSGKTTHAEASGPSKAGISTHPVLLLLAAAVLVRLLAWVYKSRKLRAQKALEEKRRKEYFLSEQKRFQELYEGKKLSELAAPPVPGDHIGPDGLPCSQGSELWGPRYTVYITSGKSRVFHCRKFCSCTVGRPVNIARAGNRRPCSKCCKGPLPDLGWYRKQREIVQICKTYKISLLPEDF